LGQVSGRLISDHFGFQVVQVRCMLGFDLSDLGSSRISNRLDSDRDKFESGSSQFDFLKKNQIRPDMNPNGSDTFLESN
jgi:hypothetical protein